MRGTQARAAGLIRKHRRRADRDRQRHRRAARPSGWWPTMLADMPAPKPIKVIVSEAGASVYSASEGGARSSPISTCRCAARSRSRAACRIRWPSWSRSIRSRSASASTSTTSISTPGRSLDAVVEDASTRSASSSTRHRALLARVSGLGAVAGRSDRRAPRRERPVRQPRELLKVQPARRRAPSSSAPASCAFATATSRSTPPPCIRKPTRSPRRSSPPAVAICAR